MSELAAIQKAYGSVIKAGYDGLEIFMMNVGNADCFLAIRHYPNGVTKTVLIDGGNKTNATDIAARLTGLGVSHINHVVNTHPHIDHAAGLVQLLEDDAFTYDHLWMHKAWNHINVQGIEDQLGANSAKWVLESFKSSLATQIQLFNLSVKKGVIPIEPFAGTQIGPFTVVGPTAEFYLSCLQSFGDADKVKQWNQFLAEQHKPHTLLESISDQLAEDAATLGDVTSPENESSIVMATSIHEKTILFTGDAGCDAFASIGNGPYGIQLKNLDWMQAPHHGSRRNLWQNAVSHFNPRIVFISAEGSRKHPSKKLVNSFKATGARVFSSHYPQKSKYIWLRHSAGTVPARDLCEATPLYDATE